MNDVPLFHDIYDYYYQPFTQTFLFKILILLGIFIFVSIIVYVIIRRKKRTVSSWEWALKEIDSLDLTSCKTKKDFKRLYFALTEIIKQYLYKRYGWKTLNKTDEELINYLTDQKFDITLLASLQKMLEGAVWIKFAGEDVIKTQTLKDLDVAKQLIKETIPQETTNKRNRR